MQSSSGKTVPSWLMSAKTDSHLAFVNNTLARREAKRAEARDISAYSVLVPENAKTTTHTFNIFDRLRRNTNSSPQYSVAFANQRDNQRRNRYGDIYPYDRTRVIVNSSEGERGETATDQDERSRYLNASWVLERVGHKWWIATQAPLPNTAHTFLSLFLQPIMCPPASLCSPSPLVQPQLTRLRTVVQLTLIFESHRRKAHAYFPSEVGKSFIVLPDNPDSMSPLKVTLLRTHTIEEAHCVQSVVSVVAMSQSPPKRQSYRTMSNNESIMEYFIEDEGNCGKEIGEPVTFQHMLYTSWPDHGIPEEDDKASLLSFLRLVDRTNRDISMASQLDNVRPDPDPPIIVGCSAGVGRTGTFIALSSLLRMYGFLPPPSSTPCTILPASPLGPLPRALNEDLIAQEVDSLREQRPGMVQRDEQMRLIYEILVDAFAGT